MNNKQVHMLSKALSDQIEISGKMVDTLDEVCKLVESTSDLKLREAVARIVNPVMINAAKAQKKVELILLELTV